MAFDDGLGGKMKIEKIHSVEEQAKGPRLVWIVVVSKPGQERRARHELKQQGFEVYLPMKLVELSSGPKKGQLLASPLFKGYLFASVPVDVAEWREIFSTYGVAGVLGCNQSRAFGIKDAFIRRLKDQEEGGFIKLGLPEDVAPLAAGDRVRHLESGFEGVFEKMLNERVDDKRAAFLVSGFMGRDSRFVVDLRELKAADRT